MASRIGSSVAALPALTGLRGVAAAWVVGFHMQAFFPPSMAIPVMGRALIGHGWVAVDLFFILSGFVLMHVHGQDFRSIDTEKVGRFLVQRFLRIYPTATAVLLLILGLTLIDPGFVADRQADFPEDFTWRAFVATLTLSTRWTLSSGGNWNLPVWSLSVEIIGYLAFPWIARAAGQSATPLAAATRGLGCILFLTLVTAISGRTGLNDYELFSIARMACGFVCGAYLARAFHLAPALPAKSASELALIAAASLSLACAVPVFMPLALLASATLVIALAYGGGLIARALSSKPLLWLGRVSFPLYLVHMVPIMWLAYRVGLAPVSGLDLGALLFGYVAVCLLLSQALHSLIEQPTHRLARRLNLHRRAVKVPATA